MRIALSLVLSGSLSLLLLAPASCSKRAEPCGNGQLDPDEVCDGEKLGEETCLSQGFKSGQLTCSADCTLDTSACSQDEYCIPACDANACESCFSGTCTSDCQEWEHCEVSSCISEATQLTFFFTSDEHGWISSAWSDDGQGFYGGVGEMMTLLQAEGYDPDSSNSLLFSDGDMWTGPAISTWFEGESVVQVMNAMGYSAAVVGNHEFDFGQDALLQRSQEANFPFLAANLKDEAGGGPPAYSQSHVVVEVNGVQVGVIGLTQDDLPGMVCSDNLQGLEETGYEQALRDTAPLALADGAEVLILISHVCPEDLMAMTSLAASLGIVLMTGGHCHSTFMGAQAGVAVIAPGSSFTKFARVDLHVEPGTLMLLNHQSKMISNYFAVDGPAAPEPEPAVEAIVDTWRDLVDQELGEVIGYTETGIWDWPMYNMTADAFLMALPDADLALTNMTGFRSSYGPGEISRADTVAVQPFENLLVEVELTGAQFVQLIESLWWPHAIAGALVDKSGAQLTVSVGGGPIDLAATFRLVTTDYMVCRPDFFPFEVPAEKLTFTDLHWRQVTEDWIRAQDSSGEDPLEEFLDDTARWVD